jgi:nitroreductase/Pyruvate/2-oxoacid:ferredoxin oxidoreductase delta subunit
MSFSIKDRGRPIVVESACTGCGLCVKNCPDEVLFLENGKAKAGEGIFIGCIACGQCAAICPACAIGVEGRGSRRDDRIPLPKAEPPTAEQLARLLVERRSIRRYDAREVEREKVDWILEMTATAPMGIPPSEVGVVVFHGREKVARFSEEMCASFKQMAGKLSPFMLGLMRLWSKKTDIETLRDFVVPLMKMLSGKSEAGEDKFTYGAPAALLFHHGPMADATDSAIAATYAMLAAEAQGLGSCLLGSSVALNYDKKLKARYGIPPENKVGLAMPFGYPELRFTGGVQRRLASVTFF